MARGLATLLVAVVATSCLVPRTWAASTIDIGSGINTACQTGGCPIFPSKNPQHVNEIAGATFDLYQQSNGAPNLANPVLLILAIPDDNGTANLSADVLSAQLYGPTDNFISNVNFSFGVAGKGQLYGPHEAGLSGGIGGAQGEMTYQEDVYTILGLTTANNSQRFNAENLQGGDAQIGVVVPNAGTYGLYVFSLDTGSFGAKDFLQIQTENIPQGTFAMGYGQDSVGGCSLHHRRLQCPFRTFDTPFTEVGLFTHPPHHAPEPASFVLLGGGLLGIAGLLCGRRSRGKV